MFDICYEKYDDNTKNTVEVFIDTEQRLGIYNGHSDV